MTSTDHNKQQNIQDSNQRDQDLFCMSVLEGKFVAIDGPLTFSFYFGSKNASISSINNDIRIKFSMGPEKFNFSEMYTLELCGDYKSSGKNIFSDEEINGIRDFFKKYKVLFAGAWEEEIYESMIVSYLVGYISLSQLIQDSPCYEAYADQLQSVTTLADLENAVRKYNIFDMHD